MTPAPEEFPRRHFAWQRHPDNGPATWGTRNLLHVLVEEPEIREHPDVELIDQGTNDGGIPDPGPDAPPDYYARVRARCPICSRRGNWTWTMADVRDLPDEITGGYAFACDGCHRGWVRSGRLTLAEWVALHGGPTEAIRRAAKDDERFGRPPKVPHLVSLPADVEDRLVRARQAQRDGTLTARSGLRSPNGGGS